MDSRIHSDGSTPKRLRLLDYLWLLLLCLLLYGYSLVQSRVFTTHETVHCQNVREMFASEQFLIPTYGGRPWLERPPLPHWMTGLFVTITGSHESDWAMRLGSIFAAIGSVLIFAWAIAGCFGRTIGLMSAAILATMREFAAYAIAPEADIFVASAATIGASLFMRLHFATSSERCHFWGGRSWLMLVFFVLLGLTNWMKGPLFGMIFIGLPIIGFMVWNRDTRCLQRFTWFWGWCLTAVIGATWPMVAYLRFPDIVDLWAIDYGVRWQSGYIGEPWWYYLVQQPWNWFPWTIPVWVGFVVTARSAFTSTPTPDVDRAPTRFIWCWALLPVMFFSLFKGKHHHYMLGCLAPAAVLGAFGTRWIWLRVQNWPGWLRHPGVSLALLGLPGIALVLGFGRKIPGPEWLRWTLLFGWPTMGFVTWWLVGRRRGDLSFASLVSIVVLINCFAYWHRSQFLDSYEADRRFVAQVRAHTTEAAPLLVLNDPHPLNSSWLLYYLGDRAQLLHNRTFLRDERIVAATVFVVCRQREEKALTEYGIATPITQSAKARGELSPDDRWTLYELKFHPNLARMPGDVRISPLQATGRQAGPFLGNSWAKNTFIP